MLFHFLLAIGDDQSLGTSALHFADIGADLLEVEIFQQQEGHWSLDLIVNHRKRSMSELSRGVSFHVQMCNLAELWLKELGNCKSVSFAQDEEIFLLFQPDCYFFALLDQALALQNFWDQFGQYFEILNYVFPLRLNFSDLNLSFLLERSSSILSDCNGKADLVLTEPQSSHSYTNYFWRKALDVWVAETCFHEDAWLDHLSDRRIGGVKDVKARSIRLLCLFDSLDKARMSSWLGHCQKSHVSTRQPMSAANVLFKHADCLEALQSLEDRASVLSCEKGVAISLDHQVLNV